VDIIKNFVFLLVGVEDNVAVTIIEMSVLVFRPFLDLEFLNSPDLNSRLFSYGFPGRFSLSSVLFDFLFDVSAKEGHVGLSNVDFLFFKHC
jgi:hypothetical protein